MAFWPVRENQVPVVIVELLAMVKRRLVQREIRLMHRAELVASFLAAEEQPARATLRRA